MFVLVDAARAERVVGISAIEAAVGLEGALVQLPRRHAGARVARARRLHRRRRRCSSPTTTPGTPSFARCSSTRRSARARTARCSPSAGCCSSPSSPTRFAPKVIAELRGRLDAEGRSPFWEGLGRHFFAMEYSTADYLTGIGQKSFIAELMPQASGVREPAAARRARRDRRGARRHACRRARCSSRKASATRATSTSSTRVRRSSASATTSTPCAQSQVHAGDAGRGGPGARQPHRRHPVARVQPPLRATSARSSSRRRRASTAFRCCPTRRTRCACRRRRHGARGAAARRRDR